MPISMEFVKVAGALRCNRWAKYLDPIDEDDEIFNPTIEGIIRESKKLVNQLRKTENKNEKYKV